MASNPLHYQGTPAHQALQRALVAYYAGDPRIRALGVFGSLGRGTWDEWSDLDLDVVVADEVRINVPPEVRDLCASFAELGERALLIVPHADAADVVLASLRQLSIRYHSLAATSPNIVDSLRLLDGPLTLEEITAAGRANRVVEDISLSQQLDVILRWTLDAATALRRGNFWQALYLLQRMREQLLVVFARTHGGARPYHTFDARAPAALKRQLGATLHADDLAAARAALLALADLVEHDMAAFTDSRAQLSPEQRAVLAGVRSRLSGINP